MVKIFLIIAIIGCISCNNEPVNSFIKGKHDAILIELQPFDNFTMAEAEFVKLQLETIYPSICINKPIPFPNTTLNKNKTRYRADSIIRFLNTNTLQNHLTIGLTHKDISTTKNKIEDWGVMGLGYCPGKACIVSTFRLNKKDQKSQLYKVALHELGHTLGLPHCPQKTCFMRDAEGKNPTNEETEFCKSCKTFLKSKGLKL